MSAKNLHLIHVSILLLLVMDLLNYFQNIKMVPLLICKTQINLIIFNIFP